MTDEELSPPPLPLETERLLLRAFRPEDYDDLHAYGSDLRVTRYMQWGPNTPEVTAEVLDRRLTEQACWPRDSLSLALEFKAARKLIGSLELRIADKANRTAEVGYCMAAKFWRRGIMTEAVWALLGLGFGAMNLHRIFATCDVRNTGSWGVMEKVGMRREGLMRQDRLIKGEWRDTYLYAMLADEHRP